MTRALFVAVVIMLGGCALINQNFDSCLLEAEKMTASLADSNVQRVRRDNYTIGFDLVSEVAGRTHGGP